jgi:protein-L-isoaspartate(D-aspartate) O-methyltransferase
VPEHPSVLLVAPGLATGAQGNFGTAHLVALGSFIRHRTGATVDIVDVACEAHLGLNAGERLSAGRHDIVGFSCYSSYEYLHTYHLAKEVRRHNPRAVLVAGGYHPSARPGDFLNLPGSHLDEPSPFDHVVVGEGELPLLRIVEAARKGTRVPETVLGPEPLDDLDDLPPMDWSLLNRYLPLFRRAEGQVTLFFSRGCSFACSFCMEQAKGKARWRAWSPARAETELLALDVWLGLRGRTLFLADALFGLKRAWRREMLERLTRLDPGIAKIWALSRVDILDEGDLERYRNANFGLGFGLESGDPDILRLTAKARDPATFHERFAAMADEAGRIDFPWGANLITGHPGETAGSLERSAAFTRRVYLRTPRLTGFLSIDPYRFYPGSVIDRELDTYAERFGTHVHRPRWWDYSEQAFCSEWVDPSRTLNYRQREALAADLFKPVVEGIAARFDYAGSERDYFRRSVDKAVEQASPGARLRMLSDYHLWQRLTGRGSGSMLTDERCVALLREARTRMVDDIIAHRGLSVPEHIHSAVTAEPRECYVREDDIAQSWQDRSFALLDDGTATVSALHAYLWNYTLLELNEGDRLLDVGAGTGYGTAVAARIVGEAGRVLAIEHNADLAARAGDLLKERSNVEVRCADGLQLVPDGAFNKVVFSFALSAVPGAYLDAVPEGGGIVAPLLQEDGTQQLTLFVRRDGVLSSSPQGVVRYVAAADTGCFTPPATVPPASARDR